MTESILVIIGLALISLYSWAEKQLTALRIEGYRRLGKCYQARDLGMATDEQLEIIRSWEAR